MQYPSTRSPSRPRPPGLPGHARKDLGGGVLEGEVIVLGAEDAPVDEEEIEAALGHVLDERALRMRSKM